MRIHLCIFLLLFTLTPATSGQQPTTAGTNTSSPETYAVRMSFNQRVRMRDGTELSADLYRPEGPGPFPVILALPLTSKPATAL